jgi:uncharacterized membrane protein
MRAAAGRVHHLRFDTPRGADDALAKLDKLHHELVIELHDAAVVSWEPGRNKPKTRQLHSATGIGVLGGAFWGLFFGVIFFVPIIGLAVGAAGGAIYGLLSQAGISDAFMADVRRKITPGTSALFVHSSDEVVDKLAAEFRDTNAELVRTNLSDEQEERLRQAFSEED